MQKCWFPTEWHWYKGGNIFVVLIFKILISLGKSDSFYLLSKKLCISTTKEDMKIFPAAFFVHLDADVSKIIVRRLPTRFTACFKGTNNHDVTYPRNIQGCILLRILYTPAERNFFTILTHRFIQKKVTKMLWNQNSPFFRMFFAA